MLDLNGDRTVSFVVPKSQYNLKGLGWMAWPLVLFGPALFERVGLSELFREGIETESTRHSAGKDMADVIVVDLVIFGAFQNCTRLAIKKYSIFKKSKKQFQTTDRFCDECQPFLK